jgi:ABC-type glycerol-3-phosphate transport system permease component
VSSNDLGKIHSSGIFWKRVKKYRGKILAYLVLLCYLLVAIFPLYWMIITGFKTNTEVYSDRPTYIIKHPTLRNFITIFKGRPTLYYFRNTMVVALVTTIICILVGTIAAFSFARYKYKGSSFIMFCILAVRIFPPISLIVPLYLMMSRLGLIDNLLGLIIVNIYLTLPFFIWIMKGFFESIPKELDEAARIDGCSRFQAFRLIIFPISFNGLAAASIITFMWTWNEFLFGQILAVTSAAKNISVGAVDFITDLNISWNQMCAYGFLASIPAFIFIILFQKYIVQGLTAGAVKG